MELPLLLVVLLALLCTQVDSQGIIIIHVRYIGELNIDDLDVMFAATPFEVLKNDDDLEFGYLCGP